MLTFSHHESRIYWSPKSWGWYGVIVIWFDVLIPVKKIFPKAKETRREIDLPG